jgi:hypothetical protein
MPQPHGSLSAWRSNEREERTFQAAWLNGGWRVEDVNLTRQTIRFSNS